MAGAAAALAARAAAAVAARSPATAAAVAAGSGPGTAERQRVTAVDPDEARRLLERELDRSAYDGAQATWWDRASRSFLDWLGSLRADGIDSPLRPAPHW